MTPPATDADVGATLSSIQRYVAVMEAERGFTATPLPEQALLLGEVVGELFKAIRKSHNLATAHGSIIGTVEEEQARRPHLHRLDRQPSRHRPDHRAAAQGSRQPHPHLVYPPDTR